MNASNTRRGGRLAVMTAVAGTVLIAAGAFWLSFTSLADLARRSGIDAGQAWAWPLIVDGIIVVATVAVVALAGTRVAWYPWLLLILGAGLSVTANSIHAIDRRRRRRARSACRLGRRSTTAGAARDHAPHRDPHPPPTNHR